MSDLKVWGYDAYGVLRFDDAERTACDPTEAIRDLCARIAKLEADRFDAGETLEHIAEAVFRIRATAMLWTLNGAVPECGHFGSIAQDADWIVGELSTLRSSKAKPSQGDGNE